MSDEEIYDGRGRNHSPGLDADKPKPIPLELFFEEGGRGGWDPATTGAVPVGPSRRDSPAQPRPGARWGDPSLYLCFGKQGIEKVDLFHWYSIGKVNQQKRELDQGGEGNSPAIQGSEKPLGRGSVV